MAKSQTEEIVEKPKNYTYILIGGTIVILSLVVVVFFFQRSSEVHEIKTVEIPQEIVVYDEDNVLSGVVHRLAKLRINLKNNSGILEIKATIHLFDLEKPETFSSYEAFYSDKIIEIAGKFSAEQLLKQKTKEQFKRTLIDSYNSEGKFKITDVSFEEFHIRSY